MADYITIDGGTSNTRVSLVRSGEVLYTEKLNFGARVGAADKIAYAQGINTAICRVLERFSLTKKDISRVIASGMITSEGGLIEVSHLIAPTGIARLAENIHLSTVDGIPDFEIAFIRGVKTVGDDLADIDMMRGEETELYGLTDKPVPDALYVLPGSHSKLIYTDEQGRINRFSTELTGEMIHALSSETILSGSIDLKCSELCTEFLISGCDYAAKHGINAALFKVRILDKVKGAGKNELYSFFLGAILSFEIENIKNSTAATVIIGGKRALKHATSVLLSSSGKKIIEIDDDAVDHAPALGAVRIYESSLKN